MKLNIKALKEKQKTLKNLDNKTLTSIIEATQSGDVKAKNYLFQLIRKHYFLYARNVLHINNIEDAEDIVQNALITLFISSKHTQLRPITLIVFVNLILQHRYINYKNKSIKYEDKMIRYLNNFRVLSRKFAYPADEKLHIKEDIKHLKKEINKLPEVHRNIYVLSTFSNLTALEIGEKLHYAKRSVNTYNYKAKKILKDKFNEYKQAV